METLSVLQSLIMALWVAQLCPDGLRRSNVNVAFLALNDRVSSGLVMGDVRKR